MSHGQPSTKKMKRKARLKFSLLAWDINFILTVFSFPYWLNLIAQHENVVKENLIRWHEVKHLFVIYIKWSTENFNEKSSYITKINIKYHIDWNAHKGKEIINDTARNQIGYFAKFRMTRLWILSQTFFHLDFFSSLNQDWTKKKQVFRRWSQIFIPSDKWKAFREVSDPFIMILAFQAHTTNIAHFLLPRGMICKQLVQVYQWKPLTFTTTICFRFPQVWE